MQMRGCPHECGARRTPYSIASASSFAGSHVKANFAAAGLYGIVALSRRIGAGTDEPEPGFSIVPATPLPSHPSARSAYVHASLGDGPQSVSREVDRREWLRCRRWWHPCPPRPWPWTNARSRQPTREQDEKRRDNGAEPVDFTTLH